MSLCLWGPTRMGKTVWARSIAPHAYFGGLFCIDEPLDNAQYAVFDDIQGGFKFFHSYKFWLGSQQQFFATDKYRGKRLIEWGRPSIYISNDNPLMDPDCDTDWLEGNCIVVHIDTPLISHASTP